MTDEETERKLLWGTSEATPPHIDVYAEMISHYSTPEEQRVTSSTDQKPSEIVDSTTRPRVSPTSCRELPNEVESSSWFSFLKLLLQTNEAEAKERESPATERSDAVWKSEDLPEPDSTVYPTFNRILKAQPRIIRSEARNASIQEVLNRIAADSAMVQSTLRPTRALKVALSGRMGFPKTATTEAIEESNQEKSNGTNPQFDADDLSSESDFSILFNEESSPDSESDCYGTRLRAESALVEGAYVGSDLSPKAGSVSNEETSLRTSAIRNVSSENESYRAKQDIFTLKRSRSESVSEEILDTLTSPKLKPPTKVHHCTPKSSLSFSYPSRIRRLN